MSEEGRHGRTNKPVNLTLDGLWHDCAPYAAVHSAFVLWGETVQRLVDPDVVTPYWDHLVRGLWLT